MSLLGVRATLARDVGAATKLCVSESPPVPQDNGQPGCPPPIDESVGLKPLDWPPWTHRLNYCVYGNLQHGRTAALSAGMLDEELPSTRAEDAQPPYQVVDIPLKGKGAIATGNIFSAEVVMSDWAAFLLDISFPETVLQLGRSSRHASDILEDVGGDPYLTPHPKKAAVSKSSSIPCAFVRLTSSSFNVRVVVLRDISPGEEISISYKRQRTLGRYSFECTCSLCTASITDIAASDYRREKIAALQNETLKAITVEASHYKILAWLY
ncbi:hypothetical protein GGS20DRAFT_580864 [Poronia punctata]|nr:hypothetical protein GGS20DRAFT_580864 [Poronia punctata]